MYFRILQSGIYEVIDGVLFDTATSFDGNKWVDTGVTRSHSVDGTTLSQGTDENARYQSKYNITDDLAVEFDIYIPSITGNDDPSLYLRGQVPSLLSTDFLRDTWNKVKIEFRHLNTKIYVNGTYLYEINYLQTNAIFQFRAKNTEYTFKNFVIYLI